jgi:elongation factor G
MLDAVVDYLPSPLDIPPVEGTDVDDKDIVVTRHANDDEPFSALIFKIMTDPYAGQLAFFRVYSGKMMAGESVYNVAKGRKERVGRLLRMHANKREDIQEIMAGDICAAVGLKTVSTGDTICDDKHPVILESIIFPTPVIQLAVEPKTKADQEKMGMAIHKLAQEDPTFHVVTDPETGQTILSGMGELHLEIIVDRMMREFGVAANVGKPQVAYRETIRAMSEYDYTHKKQTGGSGQYAHIVGHFYPLPDDAPEPFEFVDKVTGGRIPREYIPSVEKGYRDSLSKGPLAGFPIVGVQAVLEDGSYHDVDSSDMAFQVCARGCFRETFLKMKPVLLEPVMKLEVEVPVNFQGSVTGELTSRRGMIVSSEVQGPVAVIEAEVPLAETFGYSTDLRSMTQGQGTFTMEFSRYKRVPASIQEEILAEKKKQLVGAK